VPYAHAQHGEQCSRCNDPAARVVGTQAMCVDHFTGLIQRITGDVRRRILTPTDLTPDGFTVWAEHLRHGIAIGAITDDEAAKAWNTAKDFAA
jgi:hypothetical protein